MAVVDEIVEVAEKHQPDGGYGQTWWRESTGKVFWNAADWSTDAEVDAAMDDFEAIDGVKEVDYDFEVGRPDGDGWTEVYNRWSRVAAADPADRPAVSAAHHNRVIQASEKRAWDLEERLIEILEPILSDAGDEAARMFELKATRHGLTAALVQSFDASTTPSEAAGRDEGRPTMVALYPALAEAESVADGDGDAPEDLHVTLAYLGKTTGPLDKVRDALFPVAARHGRMEGQVGGVGVFGDNGEGHPAIVLPSVPGLVELRVEVTRALHDAGIEYGRNWGYQPHMTIGYRDAPVPPPIEHAGKQLTFESLWLVRGDTERVELPLVGGKAITAAGEPPSWSPPAGDEILDVESLVARLRTKTDPVRQAVIETTMRASLDGVGIAYDTTNPLTAKVLAQSGSQITSIADTTQLNVMRIVKASYDQGLSIPDTSKAIQAGMREASPARARLIARTELAGAVNGGSLAATQIVADETGSSYMKQWLTAEGAHYPRHENYDGLDGQTVGLNDTFDVGGSQLQFPGDPAGPPEEVCNCVPADTLVEMPGLRAAMRRWYEGDLIRIGLASGHVLAATPNHPVLRADGTWVPICEVNEGDDLICARPFRDSAATPNVERPPSEIGDVYRLASGAGIPERVVLAPGDLHGDSADGEVDVVAVDGSLLIDDEAASDEEVEEFGRALSYATRSRFSGMKDALVGSIGDREVYATAVSPSLVGVLDEYATVVFAHALHPQPVAVGASADRQSECSESPDDRRAADASRQADRQDRFAAVVSLTKVVKVDREPFSGHVYNLDTGAGWYTAGILATRNCRCTLVYTEGGQQTGGYSPDEGGVTPDDMAEGDIGDGGGGTSGGIPTDDNGLIRIH